MTSKTVNNALFRDIAHEFAETKAKLDEVKPLERRLRELRGLLVAKADTVVDATDACVFIGECSERVTVSPKGVQRTVDPVAAFTAVESKIGDGVWDLVNIDLRKLESVLGEDDIAALCSAVPSGPRRVAVTE